MRPVGAIVLGIYADRAGRKAALWLAMASMGLGTGLIAFAPTYGSIGVAAPLVILLAPIPGVAIGSRSRVFAQEP